jgi:hypothetical protein
MRVRVHPCAHRNAFLTPMTDPSIHSSIHPSILIPFARRYIWCINLACWMLTHAPTQVWERRSLWHTKLSKGAGKRFFYLAFFWLVFVFFLHLSLSLLFVVVFMRSVNHLSQASHPSSLSAVVAFFHPIFFIP